MRANTQSAQQDIRATGRRSRAGSAFSALLMLLPLQDLRAAVPNRIVYQGRLTKSGVSASGAHVFRARFLSAGGAELWNSGNVTLTLPPSGDFTLELSPTGVDWINDDLKLEITVDGDLLSPSSTFAAAPYARVADTALTAQTALSVANGTITRDKVVEASFQTPGTGLVPQGAILMLVNQSVCPAGYTEVTAFRNRLALGADLGGTDPDVPDSVNQTTGTKNPSHAHVHGVNAESPATTSDGTHSHNGLTGTHNAQSNPANGPGNVNFAISPHQHAIGNDGGHAHIVNPHSHGGTTAGISAAPSVHIPPALTALFCMKD